MISIIIPVYKVEQWLPKCVDSLLTQTYEDLEIILVDDGSPDGCGRICDDYATRDSRVRVIHKENAGVAMARNDGLDIAKGEYISFVDSDDWMGENAYELLINAMQKYNADCVVGSCVNMIDDGENLTPDKKKTSKERCMSSREVMKHVLLDRSAVWNRLFKREIFDEIRFPIGRVNDDEFVALRAYEKCDKIVFLADDTYYYRIRANSITTAKFSVRNMDMYYNSLDNLEFIKSTAPELEEAAMAKVVKTCLYCYHNLRKCKDVSMKELRTTTKGDVRKLRQEAMKNQYVPLQYKILAAVYSI